jgi:hypothetical protein
VSFERQTGDTYRSQVAAGIAILDSVREDVEGGHLARFADLVSASIFVDFLDMATHLATAGSKDPAASLTGAVLEDGLRRICDNAGIKRKSSDSLDALNTKCLDAGIYNALTRSKVDGWRIIRNAADHGNFTQYLPEDVQEMIAGVGGLLEHHLS